MNFFCDVINQRFTKGFRNPATVVPVITQTNDIAAGFYLTQPNGSARFPFMYDPVSGSGNVVAVAALSNPGGVPLTLVAPTPLGIILNGFSGIIRTNTAEINTFLVGYAERKCLLVVEVTDGDGNHVTSFASEVILRMASTEAGTVSIPSVIRLLGVTGYVGGGTNLDAVTTIGRDVGTRYDVTINGAESHWEYTGPGSTPSDPDSGIILTEDGGQLVRTIGL